MTKKERQEVDISEDFLVICGGLGTVAICALFARSNRKWFEFLDRLMNSKKYKLSLKFQDEMNWRNQLGLLYAGYCVIGVMGYGLLTYMGSSSCHHLNKEQNLRLICDTYFPIWLPFDIPQKSIRLMIFFTQMSASLTTVCPATVVCYLIWEATEIIGMHVRMLKEYFKSIIRQENVRRRRNGIAFFVQYHNHILELAVNLKDLVKESVGSVSLFSALVLASNENSIMKAKPICGMLVMIGWMGALMIICHAGERLMEETASVGPAVSESMWYLADEETKKDIIFILLRSQKPIYLEASPLGIMNYALFIMILRTSYSYMTLLNQTS